MKIVILCVVGCAVMVLAGVFGIWLWLVNGGSCCAVESDGAKKSVTCSEGWSQFEDRCFQYVQKAMRWAEAELNCLSMGANLASVHSMQEYQEIQRQIVAATHHYNSTWIGGSNAQQADVWLWSDGSIFQYSNWCPKEPNNAGGSEYCLRINYGDQKCWDDYQCGYFHPSVCAKAV
ncbi:ladderlectin-like [Channa argus]|uniref:ladderlectin-like n=1 Tax=Channa argus TaxID=215402 RepID=UPI0035223E6D